MSSGWFDCTEPSLSTSFQGKQGVQGAYGLVRGGSSTSVHSVIVIPDLFYSGSVPEFSKTLREISHGGHSFPVFRQPKKGLVNMLIMCTYVATITDAPGDCLG